MQSKIIAIGSSSGLILNVETLKHLHLKRGDTVQVEAVNGALKIKAHDPILQGQLDIGRDIMRRHAPALRELAK